MQCDIKLCDVQVLSLYFLFSYISVNTNYSFIEFIYIDRALFTLTAPYHNSCADFEDNALVM